LLLGKCGLATKDFPKQTATDLVTHIVILAEQRPIGDKKFRGKGRHYFSCKECKFSKNFGNYSDQFGDRRLFP